MSSTSGRNPIRLLTVPSGPASGAVDPTGQRMAEADLLRDQRPDNERNLPPDLAKKFNHVGGEGP
jgi:hypothetical protein